MTIKIPKDYIGSISIVEDYYTIGAKKYKFASDISTAKVEWNSFDFVEVFFSIEYAITTFPGAFSKKAANGRFGIAVRWRATFTDQGIQLAEDGSQPKPFGQNTHQGAILVETDTKLGIGGETKPFVELVLTIGVTSEAEERIVEREGNNKIGPDTHIPARKDVAKTNLLRRVNLELVGGLPVKVVTPKIRKETIVVGSFAFGDHTLKRIKPLSGMLDYSKFSSWYNKLPEPTLEKIRTGNPPGGKMIVMTGFTDNVGDEHQNFELGRKRAVAVAEAVEKMSGVSWEKIVAKPSKGEQDVRQENKKLEKKEDKHRRVEVTMHIEE